MGGRDESAVGVGDGVAGGFGGADVRVVGFGGGFGAQGGAFAGGRHDCCVCVRVLVVLENLFWEEDLELFGDLAGNGCKSRRQI